MAIGFVYGRKNPSTGGFEYFSDCKVKKDAGMAVCTSKNGNTVSFQASCDDLETTGTTTCKVGDRVMPDVRHDAAFLEIEAPETLKVTDVTNLINADDANLRAKLDAGQFKVLIEATFKEPYKTSRGSDISNTTELVDAKGLDRWLASNNKNLASVRMYAVEASATEPKKFVIGTADLGSATELTNTSEAIVTIEGYNSTNTKPAFYTNSAMNMVFDKSGSVPNGVALIYLKNGTTGPADPIAVVGENWEAVKAYRKHTMKVQQDPYYELVNGEKAAFIPKWRSGAAFRGDFAHNWLDNAEYHKAASLEQFGVITDVAGAKAHDKQFSFFDRLGGEAFGSFYPFWQDFVGVRGSVGYTTNGAMRLFDFAGGLELDLRRVISAIFPVDLSPIGIYLYATVGRYSFVGKSMEQALRSSPADTSVQMPGLRIGGEVTVKTLKLTENTNLNVNLGVGCIKSLGGGSATERFGESHGNFFACLATIGADVISYPTSADFITESYANPQNISEYNNNITGSEAVKKLVIPYIRKHVKALEPIAFPAKMEFVSGTADLVAGATGADVLDGLPENISTRIMDKYKGLVLNGYTLKVTVTGHTSSDGATSDNMKLSLMRAKKISEELYTRIGTMIDKEPFASLTIVPDNFFSFGMGESRPISASSGVELESFGGNENDLKNETEIDKKYRLCTDKTDPKSDHTKCGATVEEDMVASRRVNIEIEVIPAGMPVTKPAVMDLSKEQKDNDQKMAAAIVKSMTKSSWFNTSSDGKGMKSIAYDAQTNTINVAITKEGFDTPGQLEKLAAGFSAAGKNAIAASKGDISSAVTVKFWLHHDAAPADYANTLRSKFYKFGVWPFNGPIVIENITKNWGTSSLETQQSAIQKEKQDMLKKIAVYSGELPAGYKAMRIQIDDPANISRVEQMAIRNVVEMLKPFGPKITVYMNFAKASEAGEDIVANAVKNQYPELEIIFVRNDATDGNAVAIAAGDEIIDFDNLGK